MRIATVFEAPISTVLSLILMVNDSSVSARLSLIITTSTHCVRLVVMLAKMKVSSTEM